VNAFGLQPETLGEGPRSRVLEAGQRVLALWVEIAVNVV
jgi:hypothetical protein